MAKLSDLPTAAARILAACSFNSGLAVIGSTATAFTTSVAIQHAIDGIIRVLAAQTNTALAPLVAADLPAATGADFKQPSGSLGFVTQPAGTTVYYVLCVNAAGTVKVVQGTWAGQQLTLPNGYTVVGDGSVPDIPLGVAPFAVIKVTTVGSVFTPATTALTSIATFFNVAFLPLADRP
jgi:hypothetical protein